MSRQLRWCICHTQPYTWHSKTHLGMGSMENEALSKGSRMLQWQRMQAGETVASSSRRHHPSAGELLRIVVGGCLMPQSHIALPETKLVWFIRCHGGSLITLLQILHQWCH
eukprot:m.249968 g.249968  ORF g.249968 m.249968 type:complete len:111 (-) comp17516_c1_seq11:4089-4421(-)